MDKRMTLEEAMEIIDKMYQDRMKEIEENNTIYVDKLDNIKFTKLEYAAVILLREVLILERKLKNSIQKKKIEDIIDELESTKFGRCVDTIEILEELMEDK